MKRLLVVLAAMASLIWSMSSMAAGYAFIDMKKIFTEASEIKSINKTLESKFSSRKDSITKDSATLQADIKKLERDRAVMSPKDAQALADKIEKEGTKLREEQMGFQQALYAAQNEAMKGFMDKLSGIVAKIAKEKNYDFVMPKNDLLYSNSSLDITSDVMGKL